VAFSFSVMTRYYAVIQTSDELEEEGKRILNLVAEIQATPNLDERERQLSALRTLNQFRVAGKYINAQIVILNKSDKVRFSTVPDMTTVKLNNMVERGSGKNREFVYAKIPFESENGLRSGNMFLFAKVEDISRLNTFGNRILMVSFGLAALISLVISTLLQRRMSKPLKQLRDEMKSFSIVEFESSQVRSNDEIGELASSFEELAHKLKNYDEHQKNFFQNASHELKTPLMSIQGYAEAIKDGIVEGPEMDESLDIIIEESQRLKRLVDEIIYLTKLETVDDMFNFEESDLKTITESAIQSVNSLAREKNIEIQFGCSQSLVADFDRLKMKQALINIIGNGIRYAQTKIIVEIEQLSNRLVLRIIDDGRGFVLGEEKLLFERFYKGNKGGTGIGLSITKAIIEKHDGSIRASNHRDLGAEFVIELPWS